LRKRASCVKRITDRHRDILSGMSQLMYAASGVGLAAPQVGINEAMIVVDFRKRRHPGKSRGLPERSRRLCKG
jgi:peptide deformylase